MASPRDEVGEDHLLWDNLCTANLSLARPTALRVGTSARLHGRAIGGLADLLHDMHAIVDDATASDALTG